MPRGYKMRYWSGFTTNHRGYVPYEENGTEFPKVINFNEGDDAARMVHDGRHKLIYYPAGNCSQLFDLE